MGRERGERKRERKQESHTTEPVSSGAHRPQWKSPRAAATDPEYHNQKVRVLQLKPTTAKSKQKQCPCILDNLESHMHAQSSMHRETPEKTLGVRMW